MFGFLEHYSRCYPPISSIVFDNALYEGTEYYKIRFSLSKDTPYFVIELFETKNDFEKCKAVISVVKVDFKCLPFSEFKNFDV